MLRATSVLCLPPRALLRSNEHIGHETHGSMAVFSPCHQIAPVLAHLPQRKEFFLGFSYAGLAALLHGPKQK